MQTQERNKSEDSPDYMQPSGMVQKVWQDDGKG